jgi:hypothetical protein
MARTLWMDALNMRERELNVELRKKLTEIGDKVWKNPKKPTKFYGYAPPHIGKEKRYKYINAKGSVLKSGFKYWDDAHEYGMKHDGDRFGLPKGKVVRYYLAKKVKVKRNPIPKLKIEKSLETDEYVVKRYTDKGYVPIYRSMRYFDAKDHLDKISGGYMRAEKKVVKNGYVIELFTYKDGWIPIAELSSKDEAEKYIKTHKSVLISKHSPELISILSRKTRKHWTVYDRKKNPVVIRMNPKRIVIKKDYFRKGYYSVHKRENGSEILLEYFKKKREAEAFRKNYKKGKIKGIYESSSNPVYYKCMLCGRYHKDGSKILKRHIHEYYKKGGTIELSRWERKESKKNPMTKEELFRESVALEQIQRWREGYVKALKSRKKSKIDYQKKGMLHWYKKLGWESVRPFSDYLDAIKEHCFPKGISTKSNPVYIEKRYNLIPFIQKNPDTQTNTEYCVKCSSKHLGSARVNFIEALSTNDSDRQKKKLLGVMDELAEGEKHLIEQKPEAAVEIRNIRKEIEKMVFNKNSNNPVITPENIESLRWKLVKEVN